MVTVPFERHPMFLPLCHCHAPPSLFSHQPTDCYPFQYDTPVRAHAPRMTQPLTIPEGCAASTYAIPTNKARSESTTNCALFMLIPLRTSRRHSYHRTTGTTPTRPTEWATTPVTKMQHRQPLPATDTVQHDWTSHQLLTEPTTHTHQPFLQPTKHRDHTPQHRHHDTCYHRTRCSSINITTHRATTTRACPITRTTRLRIATTNAPTNSTVTIHDAITTSFLLSSTHSTTTALLITVKHMRLYPQPMT